MTAKKKKDVSQDDLIAKARKKRIALAKESEVVVDTTDQRESFRIYFVKISKKLKLNGSLEEVIWTHLKAIKHDKEELFEAGIKNFGYKI